MALKLFTLISLLSSIFISGCADYLYQSKLTPEANTLGLKPAPLPKYQAGTKYVYSNGTWERVVETGKGYVKWRNHKGNISIGSADFTYKRHTWQTEKRKGTRSFRHTPDLLAGPTSSLWPLKVGNVTKFEEFGKWYEGKKQPKIYDSFWRCRVMGTEKIEVAAGTFDTWKIACERYPDDASYPGPKIKEVRTRYYAPMAGHWVLETREYNRLKPSKRKELVAILPNLKKVTRTSSNLRQVKKQFQETLEDQNRNVASIWSGSKADLVVSITPRKSFRHDSGAVCRQYSKKISMKGNDKEYFGIACRNSKGLWKIPKR